MTFSSRPPAASVPPHPGRTSGPGAELAGRTVLMICFIGFFYAWWAPYLGAAAEWLSQTSRLGVALSPAALAGERILRVLPRVSTLALALVLALIVRGGRPSEKWLFWTGAALMICSLILLRFREPAFLSGFQRTAPLASCTLEFLQFASALLAAVLLGAWLGRGLSAPVHLLSLLACAIAGDGWLNAFKVAETAGPASVLNALQFAWPGEHLRFAPNPGWMDAVLLSAVCETVRALRLHSGSVLTGALSGYCGAAFLMLVPWPLLLNWPVAAALMSGCGAFMASCGILLGCWPEMKTSLADVMRALLLGLALLVALMALSGLQSSLQPPPSKNEEFSPARNVADRTSSGVWVPSFNIPVWRA